MAPKQPDKPWSDPVSINSDLASFKGTSRGVVSVSKQAEAAEMHLGASAHDETTSSFWLSRPRMISSLAKLLASYFTMRLSFSAAL